MRAWFVWLWLAVFVNAVAPKSFLHAFHAHEETCHGAADIVNLSSQHEHCDFLQLELFTYEAQIHEAVFIQSRFSYRQLTAPIAVEAFDLPSEKHLRGPPSC